MSVLGRALAASRRAGKWTVTPRGPDLRSPLDVWTGRGGFKRQGLISGTLSGRPLPHQRFLYADKPLRRAFHIHAPTQHGAAPRGWFTSLLDWLLAPKRLGGDVARTALGKHGFRAAKLLAPGYAAIHGRNQYNAFVDDMAQQTGYTRDEISRAVPALAGSVLTAAAKRLPGYLYDASTGNLSKTDSYLTTLAAQQALGSTPTTVPFLQTADPTAHVMAAYKPGIAASLRSVTAPLTA